MRTSRCTISCAYLFTLVLVTRGAQSDAQADSFSPFARCSSWENPYSPYSGDVKSFDAELLMDAKIDSEFGDHYNYVAEGTGRTVRWTDGRSMLNFTFRFGLSAGQTVDTGQSWKAHIHASRCDESSGGTHYLQNTNGLDLGDNIFEVVFDAKQYGDDILGSGNVTREYLADYDRAASVVVHIPGGTRALCCNLAPALPKLPDTWSATIEANINNFDAGSNLSYTMLRKEWYHAETNSLRIDEHSAYSRQTRLMNTAEERLVTMHRNDTFPDGICRDHPLQSRMSSFLTRGSSHTIKSTAEMFSFEGDAPDEYHGITASHEYVRGVPCEKWTRNVTMGTKKYTYEFFFPVSSWMIRRESYHRMLWRVVVKSDNGFRGQPVLHFYDFVDMVPYVEDMEVFNPCNVYNTGKPFAGNCTCGRIGSPAPAPASWGGGGGSGEEGMKAGEVAGLSIFFLVFGSAVSFIGTYVYFTQHANRVPLFPETEMMGHA
jgi:hypothetical protein